MHKIGCISSWWKSNRKWSKELNFKNGSKNQPICEDIRECKILWNNLPKEVQDLHTKIYKALLEKINTGLNKWTLTHCHGPKDLLLLKWQYYSSKPQLSAAPNQNPSGLFFPPETEKLIINFMWNWQGIMNSQNILEKE